MSDISIQSYFLDLAPWKKEDFSKQEIDTFLKEKIWVTANNRHLPVAKMTTEHINNCINCLNGKGDKVIPENYLGGKKKWLKIFKQELSKRN